MGYISVILVIGALVLLHELGHFLAAVRLGIPVEMFSLGFGPKLISKRWRGVEFRLSVIPIGGYVLPKVKDIEDLHSIPVKKRMLFSLGGPLMNFIVAYVIILGMEIFQTGIGWNILLTPMVRMISMIAGVFTSYAMLFSDPGSVSGVIGIVSAGGSFVGSSMVKLAYFTAFISINLGLFNLFPIPALDGGKVLFALMEKASIRTRKLQLPVTVVSVIFLIILMVFSTILDVVRILPDLRVV